MATISGVVMFGRCARTTTSPFGAECLGGQPVEQLGERAGWGAADVRELLPRPGTKYPASIRMWEQAWAEFAPFLAFDAEIRTVICSTNAIESVNARIRRAVRARSHFPNEGDALKCVYLAVMSLDPDRAGPQAMDHALETCPERLRDGLRRTPACRPKVTGVSHGM